MKCQIPGNGYEKKKKMKKMGGRDEGVRLAPLGDEVGCVMSNGVLSMYMYIIYTHY